MRRPGGCRGHRQRGAVAQPLPLARFHFRIDLRGGAGAAQSPDPYRCRARRTGGSRDRIGSDSRACRFKRDRGSVRLAGIAVLAVGASFASLAGLISSDGRSARWAANVAAYLEYVLVAALIPLALWPLGFYDRLGL